MKILYINNDGSRFADYLDVARRNDVAALFAEQLPT